MAKLISGTRIYGTGTIDTQLLVLGTTNATTTQTGALVVTGGAGIGGDLRVGGTIFGTISGAGSAGTANTSTLIVTALTGTNASFFLTFVDANNATPTAENLYTTSSVSINPSSTATLLTINGGLRYREFVQIISGNTTAISGYTYVLIGSLTLTLPATPTSGDFVKISNRSGTTTCIIGRNGSNIMSLAEDMTIDVANASFTLVFADATRGWTLL